MKCIIYLSEAIADFDSCSLNKLAEFSADRNKNVGVTGYLYFCKGKFIQYIEGEDLEVSQLMDSIREDSRHKVLNELSDSELQERRFPSWNMRFLTAQDYPGANLETAIQELLLSIESDKDQMNHQIRNLWNNVTLISSLQSRLE